MTGKLSVFLLIILCAWNFKALAIEQFDTQYVTSYEILADGITKVTQEITITNKMQDVIATNYALTIRQMDVYDISGFDKEGALKIETNQEQDTQKETIIRAKLNQQILGEGRKNRFTISYKSKDITGKVGGIWNIYIPAVSGLDKITAYDINLRVPLSLGPKIFISPAPSNEKTEKDVTTYFFSKEQLHGLGISASFGKFQLLNYKLNYQIKNTSILPTTQDIALPPEITGKQQINYKSLTPSPNKIWIDTDGNYLARYFLWPKQELNIQLVGSAKILGKQIKPENGGKLSEIPEDLVKTYTSEQKYWEVNSAEIRKLAEDLFNKEKTVSENAQSIYKYVTQNLDYNFNVIREDFVERKGALTALTKKGSYACMEFTDLFIATARAMGIPAREINGYAFTVDKNTTPVSVNFKTGDLLHAWPEFYDPQFGWVAIDPTWGSTSGLDYFTKLDTNHFAFVTKGVSSEVPLPAGAYRFEQKNGESAQKQVEVDFAQDTKGELFDYKLDVKAVFDANLIMFFKGMQAYEVKNIGGTVINDLMGVRGVLLPSQSTRVFVEAKNPVLWFLDFGGERVEKTLTKNI